jgi:hypothetical protein
LGLLKLKGFPGWREVYMLLPNDGLPSMALPAE